jgi:ABC-2 type transport system permease protein
MRALYWKEIRSFLGSTIGYIFILIFLVFSGVIHWIISWNGNLLEGAEADLIPFFNFSPYLFLILIPAITMRSIAEERRNGTIELLFTRPITDLKIILAKYFAGVTLLIISLIPTLVYYYSMRQLGINPIGADGTETTVIDEGAMLTSYLGLILLGSTFVAIGVFASSITSSQIVAFILGLAICAFLYEGLDKLGSFNLMGEYDSIFRYAGITSHYESIMRGVIDTEDMLYFFGLIAVFITAALTVVKSLKR